MESGEVKYPQNCRGSKCEYKAEWKYDDAKKEVIFEIKARVKDGRWVGIAFSKDRKMVNNLLNKTYNPFQSLH